MLPIWSVFQEDNIPSINQIPILLLFLFIGHILNFCWLSQCKHSTKLYSRINFSLSFVICTKIFKNVIKKIHCNIELFLHLQKICHQFVCCILLALKTLQPWILLIVKHHNLFNSPLLPLYINIQGILKIVIYFCKNTNLWISFRDAWRNAHLRKKDSLETGW